MLRNHGQLEGAQRVPVRRILAHAPRDLVTEEDECGRVIWVRELLAHGPLRALEFHDSRPRIHRLALNQHRPIACTRVARKASRLPNLRQGFLPSAAPHRLDRDRTKSGSHCVVK